MFVSVLDIERAHVAAFKCNFSPVLFSVRTALVNHFAFIVDAKRIACYAAQLKRPDLNYAGVALAVVALAIYSQIKATIGAKPNVEGGVQPLRARNAPKSEDDEHADEPHGAMIDPELSLDAPEENEPRAAAVRNKPRPSRIWTCDWLELAASQFPSSA